MVYRYNYRTWDTGIMVVLAILAQRSRLTTVKKGVVGQMTETPRYDYDKDPCRCPKCTGLGFPWMGYFSCDDCGSIFYIKTGEEVEVSLDGSVRRK